MMTDPDLTVTLNGEPRQLAAPLSLEGLLQQLGLDPRTVVVEHNRRIVRRAQLAETAVSQGDAIEVVHFVGGG
jgi:thiamine biosynthesis protein ThiS